MKKEKGYILKRIADEYNIFPCGEKAEETQEVLTLSESAAWICGRGRFSESSCRTVK